MFASWFVTIWHWAATLFPPPPQDVGSSHWLSSPFLTSLISVNIWHPPSSHHTHFVNHTRGHTKLTMSVVANPRHCTYRNYFLSTVGGAPGLYRRWTVYFLPSFLSFLWGNVLMYYWFIPFQAGVQDTDMKDSMSGCRVWVHVSDQPPCLLSEWLSTSRWYHWKKKPVWRASEFLFLL